jgi:hypothetical protein
MPAPCTSSASPIADAARAALEKALADGAVGILILYEDKKKLCRSLTVPNMECVRRGLREWDGEAR